ncbi:PREDICTED: uncharacterized protein LOC109189860 [Ipomoea nil]|uniref:uncharacterized protein LOC109189860 n=1 Tax=Ipomoea nil TaxID=35883 RepID=UPI000900AD2D|nr:PREDICTED: uncharacterized protein LOC109189860 [Ipomoea nil]
MSTLSWNCRGLGDSRTVRELLDIASRKKPDFIFLMEAKVGRDHAERLRVRLGFDGLFYVDNRGLSGGLALPWKTNNSISLLSYSRNHVDVRVTLPGYEPWRMTSFYGFPQQNKSVDSWNLLRSIKNRSPLSWVVLSDFNDLLFQYEKRGRYRHPEPLLRGFGEALEDCGLGQIPMIGYQFTWEKGKGTETWVEEKLDRVVASDGWRALVEGAMVYNILTRRSDHSTLFLDIRPDIGGRAGNQCFRFEMAWLVDGGCREVVEEAWGNGVEDLQARLHRCAMKLQRWGVIVSISLGNEDVFWRQRAKQHWLRGADANTRFYHMYASARKRKNTILRLKYDLGRWVDGDALKPVVMNYYNGIFTANPAVVDGADFFASVTPCVTQSHNEWLNRPFDPGEVKAALFAMFPDKAPGPDAMNPGFYQQFWDVVGMDVTDFVLDCLNSGSLPHGLNESNIVFIPKKQTPELVADLHSIALSNVVYKIIAKVIANRMKPMLGDIISISQSAFIPGRLITDNILVAAEVRHFLNRKQLGRVGWGALKLDMAKAYDRMEWSFLRKMLVALGFEMGWVNLIMECVTTVSYNIMINGTSGGQLIPSRGQLIPSRGLRQGDPLSPYLFIICAEGLSLLLQQAQDRGIFMTINYHKSNICFSKNTQIANRNVVTAVFGVQQAANFGKYLGLPAFVGRNKRAVFAYIGDKILVAEWEGWWGIHWMAWDKLSKPKKFGGLGFKDLRAFNLAMLGKQRWRFLTNPQSLVARVYKAKRRIGNGDDTLVWGDPWLMGDSTPKILSNKPEHLGEVKVSGLIDPCMVGDDFGVWLEALFQKVGAPRRVHAMAVASVDAWRAAWQHGTETATGQQRHAAPTGAAGINVEGLHYSFDASYVAASGMGVFGLILQRVDGGFVAAKNGPLPTCQGPFMAKRSHAKRPYLGSLIGVLRRLHFGRIAQVFVTP